jgi:hypothetical protein
MCVYLMPERPLSTPRKEIYHYMHNGSEASEQKEATLSDEERVWDWA